MSKVRYFVALAGDVPVAVGRSPAATFKAAGAALMASYCLWGPEVQVDVDIEVHEAPRDVFDAVMAILAPPPPSVFGGMVH